MNLAATSPPPGLGSGARTRLQRGTPDVDVHYVDAHYADVHYAVVDVETTGLDPRVHRIVECAVVELDPRGDTVDEWASLVAVPGTEELGAGWVHGITRSMLAGAPTFVELLPQLVRRLSGRVVVGHVLSFDLGHLGAEFGRAGTVLPDVVSGSVCTRDLARVYLPPGRRSLELCCAATGVAIADAHTALGDARAAAALLRWFIEAGHGADWADRAARARSLTWPATSPAATAGAAVGLARLLPSG